MSDISVLPTSLTLSSEGSFYRYLSQIRKFPILSEKEEYEYAMRFKESGDTNAAKILVQSHLRLVVKMAGNFRNYGLPVVDLVSEGNVGLMRAVKKFDPEKGFRFSTYAMWWIKAYMQEYILKSWSLVKIGTTVAQKKLFFNLNKIKKRINTSDNGSLDSEQISRIASDLNVSESEVMEMNSRMHNSDKSINDKIGDDENAEISDLIACQDHNQEQVIIENQEKQRREILLKEAISKLNEREKDIIFKRQLSDKKSTLGDLSVFYNISRERVRQIEAAAMIKIRKTIESAL